MGTGTVYPVASGHPDLSGTYIPTLYAAKLLVEFYKKTVFAAISNTEYEGLISKQGDKVVIRTLPDITINDHVKGQELEYETPEPSTVELLIDKGKSWSIAIDLVDKRQSDIDFVTAWAMHASETMQIAIDTAILADIPDDVHASNTGASAGAVSGDLNLGVSGTPLSITKSNVITAILTAGLALDEQNVPTTDRFCVLPSWACMLLKDSDLKDASLTGDGKSTLRNGQVGMIDHFTIYSSNSILTTADGGGTTAYSAMFGQKSALTFASQIVAKETLKNPKTFGDLMRALQVYGYKVVKPEALGHLYIDKG